MGVFNIKRRRFDLLSEYQSSDLTSVALMKRGKKVVCGSSQGTVYIFNWNGFGATSDRFALRAESVDCIAPISDSIICAASMDGYIRSVEPRLINYALDTCLSVVGGAYLSVPMQRVHNIASLPLIRAINILPNRIIGCIGQHVGEPVEELAKSWDSRFLLSCAHDQLIKFWDISSLATATVNEHRKRKKKDGRMKSLSKKALGDGDFFSGLVEEPQKKEEEEVDDSDSGSD